MALGGKVDDAFDVVICEEGVDQRAVTDVSPHELETRVAAGAFERLEMAAVGEGIDGDEPGIRSAIQEVAHEVGANEAGRTGDQ